MCKLCAVVYCKPSLRGPVLDIFSGRVFKDLYSCGPLFSKDKRNAQIISATLENSLSQLHQPTLISTAPPSRFKFPSLFTFSVSWKVENLSNVASWKVRWGRGQNRQIPATAAGKVEPHGTFRSHANPRPTFCTGKHFSIVHPHSLSPSFRLLSFVCSEVRHIDRGPIKNHNQMRTLGGGQVEGEMKKS